MTKKILSLFLSVILLFSISTPAFAQENSLSYKQAVAYLRQEMVKHNKEITIRLQDSADDETAKSIFTDAIQNTGNPHEGDYLSFSTYWPWYYPKTEIKDNSITYKVNYSSTAEQEEEVDEVVKNVVSKLTKECKTDYKMICSINDWIVDNIEFENVSISNQGSGYSAFVQKKTPCRGYAVAFVRLCTEVGIDARVVYKTNKQHEWNIVKLDGKWYHIDCQGSDYKNEPRLLFLRGTDYWSKLPHTLHSDFENYNIPKKDYTPSSNQDAHSYDKGRIIQKPTCAKAGKKLFTCTKCSKQKTVTLAKTNNHKYYSRVTKAPTVKANGVMTYTCSVCSKKYTKAIDKLQTTSITKLTPKSKGFVVEWKKRSTASGYQIRYSSNSKMKNARTRLLSAERKSTTYSKLGSKKKYYVQIRTYRVIKSKKYYSDWSAKKTVTTKK